MLIDLLKAKKDKKIAIALGYFDAIHLGHQSIFAEVIKQTNTIPSVFTFSNNIYKLLNKDVKEIYTFEERCRLMYSCGIKDIYYLEATPQILSLSGQEFLDMLTNNLDISVIVTGEDYAYGKNANCTVNDLIKYSKDKDILYKGKSLITYDGKKVSSSAIREFLCNGDMRSIKQLLGRHYSVSEKVMHGRKSGKTIGFPTVNMPLNSDLQSPKFGVYASNVIIDNATYKGITNVGTHPTFKDYSSNIETHIMDFEGDLYNRTVVVEFVEYVREIRCFCSTEELKTQISADVKYREELQ